MWRRCLDVVGRVNEKLLSSFNFQAHLVLVRLDEMAFHLKNPLADTSFSCDTRLAPQQDLTSKQAYLLYQSRMFVNRLVSGTNLRRKCAKHLLSKW